MTGNASKQLCEAWLVNCLDGDIHNKIPKLLYGQWSALILTDKYLKFQKQKKPDRSMQWLHLKIIRTENTVKLAFLEAWQNISVCCTTGKVPLRKLQIRPHEQGHGRIISWK